MRTQDSKYKKKVTAVGWPTKLWPPAMYVFSPVFTIGRALFRALERNNRLFPNSLQWPRTNGFKSRLNLMEYSKCMKTSSPSSTWNHWIRDSTCTIAWSCPLTKYFICDIHPTACQCCITFWGQIRGKTDRTIRYVIVHTTNGSLFYLINYYFFSIKVFYGGGDCLVLNIPTSDSDDLPEIVRRLESVTIGCQVTAKANSFLFLLFFLKLDSTV
jgi:hypothetical protein